MRSFHHGRHMLPGGAPGMGLDGGGISFLLLGAKVSM